MFSHPSHQNILASSSIYSPRVCLPMTSTVLWCTSSASNKPTFPPQVSNSYTCALKMCLLYLRPCITRWWLSDPKGLKESGWRILCIIWKYFATTAYKLPAKAGHTIFQALHNLVPKYLSRVPRYHMKGLMSKQKEEGLPLPFRSLHSVINSWMRVIKQSSQEKGELKFKMEICFLTHARMSRTSLYKHSFQDELSNQLPWQLSTETDFSSVYKWMYWLGNTTSHPSNFSSGWLGCGEERKLKKSEQGKAVPFLLLMLQRDLTTVLYQSRKISSNSIYSSDSLDSDQRWMHGTCCHPLWHSGTGQHSTNKGTTLPFRRPQKERSILMWWDGLLQVRSLEGIELWQFSYQRFTCFFLGPNRYDTWAKINHPHYIHFGIMSRNLAETKLPSHLHTE